MAYSYINYDGDGEQVNYSVPFLYIIKPHVLVYVQGLLKTVDVHYTWLNASVIQFTSAPADATIISIVRNSGRDARIVDFVTGNLLKEADLDKDSTQLFYLMQEAFDALVSASGEDSAIFSTPEAILDAFTDEITYSHLAEDLTSSMGYNKFNYETDAIYEFDEDGLEVYEEGVLGHGTTRHVLNEALALAVETRVTTAEIDINAAEAQIVLNVTDITTLDGITDAHAATLVLMADEFFVKLDNNGNVAGFGLINDETSQFIVNADQFAIIKADGTGDIQVPFLFDATSGIMAIDGNLIATGTITAFSIGADQIEATHMGVDSILAASIKAGEIDTGHLAADCITADEIDALAVDTEHLAADCITAAKIDALAVEAGHINADAVTATEINVASLAAIAADLGSITAGDITLDSSGFIRTSGKDNYADETAGFFLGFDGGAYKLNLGDADSSIKWTGDTMILDAQLGGVRVGDFIEAQADTSRTDDNTSWQKKKEILIARAGTYRIVWDVKTTNNNFWVKSQIRVSDDGGVGSIYGIEHENTNESWTTITEELYFTAGQYVSLYCKYDFFVSNYYSYRNFELLVATPIVSVVIQN